MKNLFLLAGILALILALLVALGAAVVHVSLVALVLIGAVLLVLAKFVP